MLKKKSGEANTVISKHKALVIKAVRLCYQDRLDKWNRLCIPETDTYIYGYFIFFQGWHYRVVGQFLQYMGWVS